MDKKIESIRHKSYAEKRWKSLDIKMVLKVVS